MRPAPRTPRSNDASDGGQQYRQYTQFLQSVVGRNASFVDSGNLVPAYRGTDGIHYEAGAATAWADAVFRSIV